MNPLTTDAVSNIVVPLILCTVAVVLTVFIILPFLGFTFFTPPQEEPCIFEIIDINHTDEKKHNLNFDSRVSLWYNPNAPPEDEDTADAAMTEFWSLFGARKTEPDRTRYYVKNDLYPTFFKNGRKVEARINTMEAHKFIQSHHTGTQYMTGEGSMWCPNGRIIIDFADGTFRPGDVVRVEIRDVRTDALISADTYTA